MVSGIVLISANASRREPPLRADQLVRTLSALVPAAVEGHLSEVILAGSKLDPGHRIVADYAGCAIFSAENDAAALQGGLQHASKAHVLVLQGGTVPEEGFAAELGFLLRDEGTLDGAWLLRERRRSWLLRMPILGILAPRQQLLAAAAPDFHSLVRSKPARDLTVRAGRAV